MTPERWARVTELFDAASQVPPAAREAWLEAIGDDELRAEVRAMLASYDTDPGFLEQPLAAVNALEQAVRDPLTGRRLGPWRLVRKVGQGGMGVVYEAHRDDDAFDGRAAVKVLPAWSAGTLTERFRFERRVLAGLDHPGIARLIDAGSGDDGLPYCVMEFVDGAPIDAWCRERSLPLGARVDLFLRVCDAVAYAHQHLVVHRDIKPANIHLGRLGLRHDVVKVLDFGLVKAVGGDQAASLETAAGVIPGTPAYISPEMALAQPIDGRSDLYSLGAVAYYLLSGHLIFEGATSMQMLVRRLQEEPPPVSTRTELPIPPALDRIVQWCLRRSPDSRPQTAGELSQTLGEVPVVPWTEAQAREWWSLNHVAPEPIAGDATALVTDAAHATTALNEKQVG